MKTGIEIAAVEFIKAHNPRRIDVDYLAQGYGSVEGYIYAEGQPTGDKGGRYIEVGSFDSIDGTPKIIEWFEDAWQITYYAKPLHERTSRDDCTPEMDFDNDFDFTIEKALDLLTQPDVHDLRVVAWRDGEPEEDIDIDSYEETL